jgi:hypothetical protein
MASVEEPWTADLVLEGLTAFYRSIAGRALMFPWADRPVAVSLHGTAFTFAHTDMVLLAVGTRRSCSVPSDRMAFISGGQPDRAALGHIHSDLRSLFPRDARFVLQLSSPAWKSPSHCQFDTFLFPSSKRKLATLYYRFWHRSHCSSPSLSASSFI